MSKVKTEFYFPKQDILPMLFLCLVIMLIGGVMLGSFTFLENMSMDYCLNTATPSECQVLTTESH